MAFSSALVGPFRGLVREGLLSPLSPLAFFTRAIVGTVWNHSRGRGTVGTVLENRWMVQLELLEP